MQPKRTEAKRIDIKTTKSGKIAKEERKFTSLFQTYNGLLREIDKISNREVQIGEDYDEDEEEKMDRKLSKLTKRALRLHQYLVRKGRIVDNDGQKLKLEEPEILNITGTGNQFLDEMVTNHINQRSDNTRGFELHCGKRCYLTIDELQEMVEKLRQEGKLTDCPEDEEEMRQFLITKFNSIWQQEKDFIKQQVRRTLEEYLENNDKSYDSLLLEEETDDGQGTSHDTECSYEIAMMKVIRAAADGSLAVSEKDGDEVSTASGEDNKASGDEDEMTEKGTSEDEEDEEDLEEDEEDFEIESIDIDSSDDEEKMDDHKEMGRSGDMQERGDAESHSNCCDKKKMNSGADVVNIIDGGVVE